MPPKKLPDSVIADFEKWIEMGLGSSRWITIAKSTIDLKRTQALVYQPIHMPERPQVKDANWPQNSIDYFTLLEWMTGGDPVARATTDDPPCNL